MLTVTEYVSPCGDLLIGDCDGRICMCDWLAGKRHDSVYSRLSGRLKVKPTRGSTPLLERAVRELDEYFSWRRTEFDLPVMLVGTENGLGGSRRHTVWSHGVIWRACRENRSSEFGACRGQRRGRQSDIDHRAMSQSHRLRRLPHRLRRRPSCQTPPPRP